VSSAPFYTTAERTCPAWRCADGRVVGAIGEADPDRDCVNCKGTGRVSVETTQPCPTCDGRGTVTRAESRYVGTPVVSMGVLTGPCPEPFCVGGRVPRGWAIVRVGDRAARFGAVVVVRSVHENRVTLENEVGRPSVVGVNDLTLLIDESIAAGAFDPNRLKMLEDT